MDLAARAAHFVATPSTTLLATLITHRRCFLRELELCKPHHIHLGPASMSLLDWVNRPLERRSVDALFEKTKTIPP